MGIVVTLGVAEFCSLFSLFNFYDLSHEPLKVCGLGFSLLLSGSICDAMDFFF